MSPRPGGGWRTAIAAVPVLALLAYLLAGLGTLLCPAPVWAEAEALIILPAGEEPGPPDFGGACRGIAIPAGALRRRGGDCFVLVRRGEGLQKKTVNIILEGGDFYLAEAEEEPGSLRHGDRLLIAGEELFEGKILT